LHATAEESDAVLVLNVVVFAASAVARKCCYADPAALICTGLVPNQKHKKAGAGTACLSLRCRIL
jgi:hypothetical protein